MEEFDYEGVADSLRNRHRLVPVTSAHPAPNGHFNLNETRLPGGRPGKEEAAKIRKRQ